MFKHAYDFLHVNFYLQINARWRKMCEERWRERVREVEIRIYIQFMYKKYRLENRMTIIQKKSCSLCFFSPFFLLILFVQHIKNLYKWITEYKKSHHNGSPDTPKRVRFILFVAATITTTATPPPTESHTLTRTHTRNRLAVSLVEHCVHECMGVRAPVCACVFVSLTVCLHWYFVFVYSIYMKESR